MNSLNFKNKTFEFLTPLTSFSTVGTCGNLRVTIQNREISAWMLDFIYISTLRTFYRRIAVNRYFTEERKRVCPEMLLDDKTLEARLGPSFQFQDNCWVASDCTAYYFKD
jgi:hypothetical protein